MRDQAPLFQGFRIYPRGFLGASVGIDGSLSDRPFMSQIQTHQYHPEMFQPPKMPKEVNNNVERLWQTVLDKQGIVGSFEFREKILQVAFEAFGTISFFDWIAVQLKGPSTGDMHIEFLKDTMKFIMTGKRKLSLHSWTDVLTLSSITSNETVTEAEIASFFVNADTKQGMNIQLIDVIQRWCAQEGGFEDLVQTLHVLFGSIKA